MSQSTPPPRPPAPGGAPSPIAGRLRRLYRVDDWIGRAARELTYSLPPRLLSVVLAALGSLLIWIVPRPAVMLGNLFNGLGCIDPPLENWVGLSCEHAPAIRGVPWHMLLFHVAKWLFVFLVLLGGVWLVARLFVSLSSRILASDLVRIRDESDIARKVLIMGLSALPEKTDPEHAIAEAAEWASDPGCYAGPAAEWRKRAGSRARAAAGGWQQAARMVHAHLAGDRLKAIYVLPSAETKDLLPHFTRYLETLFGRPLAIRPVTRGDDALFEDRTEEGDRRQSYDNYTYLRDGLIRAVEMAKADFRKEHRRRLWDNEICVDATAGFKLFSIAAAVASFDRNIVLGYVVSGGPNPDEGMVKLYDPRLDFLQAVTKKVLESQGVRIGAAP